MNEPTPSSHDTPTRHDADPVPVDPTKVTSSQHGPASARPIPAREPADKTALGPPECQTSHSPFGPGNEPPDTANALPQSLQSRYRLIRVLGKGGFANVYLAYDSVLDQQVAIKILKLGLASRTDHERFLLEARIGAKLRHPNIATVFDIVQTPDGLQMVMEYYPGGTLTDRIKTKGPMRHREAIDIIRQVAQALAYAHQRAIVHRDIKPANIFLAGDGMVKLGDFGIATHTENHEYTQTGVIIGTPLYMAPEQASDSRDVDPRTDIYALGLTLYHMLTGRPPRVVDLEAIPVPFRKLIKSSTESNRNERLVSAEQFIAMLDQIELGSGAITATPLAGLRDKAETELDLDTDSPGPSTPSEQLLAGQTSPPAVRMGENENVSTQTPGLAAPATAQPPMNRPFPPRAWQAIAALLIFGTLATGIIVYLMTGQEKKGPTASNPVVAASSPTSQPARIAKNSQTAQPAAEPTATARPVVPAPSPVKQILVAQATPTVAVTPLPGQSRRQPLPPALQSPAVQPPGQDPRCLPDPFNFNPAPGPRPSGASPRAEEFSRSASPGEPCGRGCPGLARRDKKERKPADAENHLAKRDQATGERGG